MSKQEKIQIKVTRETNLGAVVRQWPQTAKVMLDYGLHCAGCFANQFDTVEQGAAIHGMNEEELNEMIGRINEAIKNSPNEENSENSN
jgi:hybrid cluster-associated redox disulfide protein